MKLSLATLTLIGLTWGACYLVPKLSWWHIAAVITFYLLLSLAFLLFVSAHYKRMLYHDHRPPWNHWMKK